MEKTKKPASKKPSAKNPLIDWNDYCVTGAELAKFLGIATPNITNLVNTGLLLKNKDKTYNLQDSVRAYVNHVKGKKSSGSIDALQAENLSLKNEKIKIQLRDWRMQRDREVALEIIRGLKSSLNELKEECLLVPNICAVIDRMVEAVARTDVDSISYQLEGETDDEND